MRKKLLFAQLLFLTLFSSVTFAQNIDVTGRVTEDNGTPVAGATVAVKGSTQATTTNASGDFSINVKKGATLTISYVGFAPQTVVASGSAISVKLLPGQDLNEVVVTALGIKKEKRALGYALTEVKGDELTQARSVNVINSLAGKVAGLNVTGTANGPGGAQRITIRGNASINGQNQPLIVVDGIPFNNSNQGGTVGMWGGNDKGDGLSSLNPDEIESMTVLKGGTAAALYGSRASNGAILVTTKQGSKGGKMPTIEVNSNFVIEDILNKKIKDYQYEYGTGDLPSTPGALQGVKPTTSNPNDNQTNSWGAKLDGTNVLQYDGTARPYVAQEDNFKKFYDVGRTWTNSFAISGGSEKVTYRFSMSNMESKGIVPNNTLGRDNVAINVNANLSKRFSMLFNGKYARERNKNRPRVSDSPGSANYALWTLPTSLDVETMKAINATTGLSNKYQANMFERVWSNNQYVQNPYYATEDFTEKDTRDRFIGAVEPRFNITDWLYVKGRAGFDKYTWRENDITPTGTGYQVGGGYNTSMRDFRESNLDIMLGVNKDITQSINVNAIIGGNRMRQITQLDGYSGGPFNIPFFYDISNVSTPNRGTQSQYFEKRINSVYGTADISYKNFLFLNLTGRNDWFSTLAPGENSIFYPSVGLSLILSDAFSLPSSINYAKLRGSWAQTGGDTDPYKLNLTYSLTGATQNAPLGQISQSEVPNSLLQPYLVTSSEIGLEARMFNNRLGLDLAVYNRKTTNDIVGASISPTSGYTSALFNVGEISNKGIELLLSYKVGDPKGFTWEPSFNMGYNKSEVVQIYGTLDKLAGEESRPRTATIYQVVGQPFAQILGVAYKRDPKTGAQIFDAQGLPIAESGLKAFGTGVPPLTMGFTNSFHYKQFGLSFLIDGKFGGYIYSGTNALAYRYGLHKETLPGRETGIIGNGLTETGTTNNVKVAAQTYYQKLYSFAEPFVYSSDFIKLRQLIIDYTIPAKTLGKTGFIKGAVVSIVGRNLWTIMKKTPIIDPESYYSNANTSQGQEFAGLPVTRTIGFNLSLRF